ncbi:MAG: hypothetical protein QXX17_01605 [Conexivisphaerales archaeon]
MKKVKDVVSGFEELDSRMKIPVSEVEVDEQYQRAVRKFTHRRLRPHVWVVNVLDPRTKYLIASEVVEDRDFHSLLRVFRTVERRVGSLEGKILRADGLAVYQMVARKFKMNLYSKTKSEELSFINRIEALHSKLRRSGLRRGKSFYVNVLKIYLELQRFRYNFFVKQDVLGGLTPFERATGYSIKNWKHLIRIAETLAPHAVKPRKARTSKMNVKPSLLALLSHVTEESASPVSLQ